jgi:hypothetical protein
MARILLIILILLLQLVETALCTDNEKIKHQSYPIENVLCKPCIHLGDSFRMQIQVVHLFLLDGCSFFLFLAAAAATLITHQLQCMLLSISYQCTSLVQDPDVRILACKEGFNVIP